jgi:putative phage-type endonuclease
MKIVTIKQRTREWLEWRRTKITAGDAPVVMGVSPYKKLDKLYEEKIRCYETNTTPWMQRGIDLEPIALEAFEKETGLIMFPCVGEHENGWMAASFDGMTIDGDAIVEIKVPGKKDHDLALNGEVPQKYLPQIYHQIHVAGLEMAYYYSFDGTSGIILEVPRDDEFIEKMIAKEFEFWQCLQTLTPPTIEPKTRKRKNAAGAIP